MVPKIEALIFDLGRVLVEVDLTRGIFNYTLNEKKTDEKQVLDALMKDPFYREYACGRVAAEKFYDKFCTTLKLDLDFETFKTAWNNVFKPIPEMLQIVKKVKKDYEIGLLSDIGPLHWEHLSKTLPVLELFENPVLSYRIGYLKPARETYLLAADSVGSLPENCLFIDDRNINVIGALEAGMQALQFMGPESLKKELKKMGIPTD